MKTISAIFQFLSSPLSLQCPTCKTIYGVKTGNQPAGKMEYHVIPHSLPGHPDCKTIRIIYNIPPGIQVSQGERHFVLMWSFMVRLTVIFMLFLSFQGPEHPNPGKPFTARGFPRHCYLPDSEKGRKVNAIDPPIKHQSTTAKNEQFILTFTLTCHQVLRLLLVAWDRRLIFSVGTSSTTGESDTVIWNEVRAQ